MGRRTIEERFVRSLNKTGGGKSYIVTIPIEFIGELGWQSKQKLVVKRHKDGIFIKDWEPEKKG